MPTAHHTTAMLIVSWWVTCLLGCTEPARNAPLLPPPLPATVSASTKTAGGDWPLFRSDAACQGVATSELPEKPQLLWKVKPGASPFDATAVIVDQTVYVGDGEAFYALALADGKLRWSVPVDQGFLASAAVRDGHVYVGDAAGVFLCLSTQDGHEVWRYVSGAKINSSANLFEDSVLFGSQDGSLYRLRCSDGKLIWKYTIKAEGGIQSSPSLSGDNVLFAGCDGSLHVVNVETGEHLRSIDLRDPTLSSAAILGSNAYFGTEGGNFLGIDWRLPKLLWTHRNPRSDLAYRCSAAVTANRVVFGGRNKAVEGLDPKDGKPVWSFMTGGAVDSSPVVAGDRVYFGSADGRIYGLSLDSGRLVWKHDTGGGFTAAPAIAQGRLVIGNENGAVYCFGAVVK